MSRAAWNLLAVSLAANLALAAVLTIARAPVPLPASPANAPTQAKASAAPTTVAAPDTPAAAPPAWNDVYSDDPMTLVANLRAAGMSPTLVRLVAGTVISEAFAERREAIINPLTERPYWMPRTSDMITGRSARLREISREQNLIMTQVLGEGWAGDETEYYTNRRLGFLPADKIEIVRRIEADYGELASNTMMEAAGSVRLPEDREKLALYEREKRADLVAALTSEELEAYDLRLSNTAQSLRNRLGDFEPTEAEFRAVFQLQRAFDEQYNPTSGGGPTDQALMQQRMVDQEALNNQIRQTLGEARYGEFERGGDRGYRYAVRIAEHFKLPMENAIAVFELQKDYQARMQRLPPNPEERTAVLLALASAANEELSTLLTPAGADAYKQTGGSWLRTFERGAPAQLRPPP